MRKIWKNIEMKTHEWISNYAQNLKKYCDENTLMNLKLCAKFEKYWDENTLMNLKLCANFEKILRWKHINESQIMRKIWKNIAMKTH
jgi:hypothetical protein